VSFAATTGEGPDEAAGLAAGATSDFHLSSSCFAPAPIRSLLHELNQT
jgi:hypothetical protein